MTKDSSLFLFSRGGFRSSRTLSAGMASASSTSKLACGVFSSCTCRFAFGAENICYSRWSRRLSLQSTIGSSCANRQL